MLHDHTKASQLLQNIHGLLKEGPITVQEFVNLLGDRSFALSILIFSLPNSLPIPGIPGFSTLTGIPILIIAMQMVLGKQTIWLPKKIANKSFSQATLSKILTKSTPFVAKFEKLLHPRLSWFCTSWGERAACILIVFMAFILSLPIVGGNFLPGMSISLIALALLERDGLFAIFSMGFCLASIAVMYKLIAWAFMATIGWLGM